MQGQCAKPLSLKAQIVNWWLRKESNLHLVVRSHPFYPLYYRALWLQLWVLRPAQVSYEDTTSLFHLTALWLRGEDSNLRPPPYEGGELTTALPRNIWWFFKDLNLGLPLCKRGTLAAELKNHIGRRTGN